MGKDLKGKEIGDGIRQKENGSYEARYVDRFGKRRSLTGKNLKEVKKRLNELIYENEKEVNIRDNLTLDEWYDKWMKVYKIDNIRPNTYRHYNTVYQKHIKPELGRIKLKDITQLQIRELLRKLTKQGYQYETKNKVKILLVDMFNKALEDEFAKKNPAKGIHIPKPKDKEIRALTKEEQADFFDCCKGTFYDNLFVVAVNTGMRIGELAGLKASDINWEQNYIHVQRTLVYSKYEEDEGKTFHIEDPKTETSKRKIPMTPNCITALKKQILQKYIVARKMPPEKTVDKEFKDFLFTTKFNTPLNPQIVIEAIKRITDEVNLIKDPLEEIEPFSCHCFRHTFATRCFEAGIKPKTIQGYLGHATLQMTMDLYAVLFEDFKQEEMEKLNLAFKEIELLGDRKANQDIAEIAKETSHIIQFCDVVGK